MVKVHFPAACAAQTGSNLTLLRQGEKETEDGWGCNLNIEVQVSDALNNCGPLWVGVLPTQIHQLMMSELHLQSKTLIESWKALQFKTDILIGGVC